MTQEIYTEEEQKNLKYTVGQAISAAQTYLGERGYGRDVIWEASSAVPRAGNPCDKRMKISLQELNALVDEMVDRTMGSRGHSRGA